MRLVLSFIVVHLLLNPSIAHACSCAGGGGPACEEAWTRYTSAVFLGKVARIEAIPTGGSDPGPALSMTFGGAKRVQFAIEEAYLGVSGQTVTVTTNSNEAGCGYPFVEGERYVVYAGADGDGHLGVSLCSRTRPAKYADEDSAYFRSLPRLPPISTITGSVWRYTHDPNFRPKFQPSIMDHYRPPEQEYMAMVPVPGMTVVAKAKDGIEHTTVVASDGEWSISGLSPGSYVVDVRVNEDTFVHPYRGKIEVAARGCARVEIRVETNGRLLGEFTHGAPEADWVLFTVFALPVAKPDLRHPTMEMDLDLSTSAFEVAPLPPGRYILGVYLVKKVTIGDGYTFRELAPTYFPGVTDIRLASPIEVQEGQAVSGLKIVMQKTGFLPDGWRCEICDEK